MKRKKLNDWLIDGQPMLSPDEGINTIFKNRYSEDSGYDEGGFYHPILERPDVGTWEFVYSILDQDEYAYMQSLFKGKSSFQFTYLDDDDKSAVCEARREGSSAARKNSTTKQYLNYKIVIQQL